MKWRLFSLISALLLIPLLIGCGAPTAAQNELPTPTPLPADPALERQTYTVKRGLIERVLTINGRIMPVDLMRMSFRRNGRVAVVNVKRGDLVKTGDILAELQQDEALDELRQAEDAVVQAQRDLENAKKQQQKDIKQKLLALEQAQEDLKRLLPGGEEDPIRKAQKELEAAQREAEGTNTSASEAKTNAEYNLIKQTEALSDTQRAYSKAYWDYDWVQRYGTDPKEPPIDPETGERQLRRKLLEEEKEQYRTALVQAERNLRDAERALEKAQRELEKLREDEIVKNDEASEKVQEAQRKLDSLLKGKGNKELIQAQRAVQEAQLAVEEARTGSFNAQIKAVENAQRALEKARRKVDDGRLVAKQNGEVLSLAISEGDQAEEFQPVIEIADPSQLEVGAELGADQMRQLAEGQPVEVTLLSRPDIAMPAVIRRLPAPYGSGGSGVVEEQDRTTRFQVTDVKGLELVAGTVAKIRIVLEQKENVLWLPPDAVRSFEGRRFVVVRKGDREMRVSVKIGIETEERVEILEGVEEGDVIVGL